MSQTLTSTPVQAGTEIASVCAAWPQGKPVEPRPAFDEEAALVRRAQASDETAFREIVERYQAMVFSIVRRILRTEEEVEDIAQTVFVRVFFSIGRFEYQGSLLSWIYRIAVNECYSHLRWKKVRRLVNGVDTASDDEHRIVELRSPARPIDKTLADRDLAVKLLARVSDQERCLLLMREVEGYSLRELYQFMGIQQSCLKVKLLRARRKLLKAAGQRGWISKAAAG